MSTHTAWTTIGDSAKEFNFRIIWAEFLVHSQHSAITHYAPGMAVAHEGEDPVRYHLGNTRCGVWKNIGKARPCTKDHDHSRICKRCEKKHGLETQTTP